MTVVLTHLFKLLSFFSINNTKFQWNRLITFAVILHTKWQVEWMNSWQANSTHCITSTLAEVTMYYTAAVYAMVVSINRLPFVCSVSHSSEFGRLTDVCIHKGKRKKNRKSKHFSGRRIIVCRARTTHLSCLTIQWLRWCFMHGAQTV